MAKQNILTRTKKKKAITLAQAGRLTDARALYMDICRIDRQDADAWVTLGAIQGMLGQHAEAADCQRQAIAIQPKNPEAHYNLGVALRDQGRNEEAIKAFQTAIHLNPNYADAYDNLAMALLSLKRYDDAITAFEGALQFHPSKPELHSNLGKTYQAKGYLKKAETCFRRALQFNPDSNTAYEELGNALRAQGKHEEALACYREALRKHPKNAYIHSNLLLTLNYLFEQDPLALLEEHRAWGSAHPCTNSTTTAFTISNEPHQLRVGYISPDFRTHSVAYFIEPLLRAHNRSEVEIYCYSNVLHPDDTTQRLHALTDNWRDISSMTDQQVIERIRSDSIDILIDLAGHTGANRLWLFSCRLAPVQITYLGYPNTTGLSTMDYRITDMYTDPEGYEKFNTEKLLRLPGCFLCYQSPADAPDIVPLPASTVGNVTFGSFNNLAKINPQTIQWWAEILRALPESRLILKNHSISDPDTRERYMAMFREHGIDDDRIELVGHAPSRAEHLALYNRVDIALDTFPYNGTTTTCEALWMGVPTITLTGATHASRVGFSLLTAAGLGELATKNPKDYIARAICLAENLGELSKLRLSLRERLRTSELLDAATFITGFEKALRRAWQNRGAHSVQDAN